MYSIHYTTRDPYSLYGIHHFIERSGIPCIINPLHPSPIAISYGTPVPADFSINVRENVMQDRITGTVSCQHNAACICEHPHEMETTKHGVLFDNRNSSYPCSSICGNHIDIGIDLFRETGHLLSGHLDLLWNSLPETEKTGVSQTPSVDFLEQILLDSVAYGCRALQVPLVQTSPWPSGKTFAVCLTHDVDEVKKTYQWFTRPARAVMKRDVCGLKGQLKSFLTKLKGVEPYWTFEDITAIEREYHARSTFFFLQESGMASPLSPKTWNLYGRTHSFHDREVSRAITMLSAAGHEIGIHGSFYSYNNPELLTRETRELETVLGKKVIGIRQHHLNLTIPLTWNYQIQAGLKYDCSLGYRDRIGFRWGTAYPFAPFDGTKTLPILEIPLTIMDICLLPAQDPVTECKVLANQVERYRGVLTLLWHPPVFNTSEFPHGAEWYREIIATCAAKDAWIAPARDIAGWQKARNTSPFTCSWDEGVCSVRPLNFGHDYFVTFTVPRDAKCDLVSENAEIISRVSDQNREASDLVSIRTHHLEKNRTIEVSMV